MTHIDDLKDELQYLNEKLLYFKNIRFEVMIYDFEKRIFKVKEKIKSLTTEPIY